MQKSKRTNKREGSNNCNSNTNANSHTVTTTATAVTTATATATTATVTTATATRAFEQITLTAAHTAMHHMFDLHASTYYIFTHDELHTYNGAHGYASQVHSHKQVARSLNYARIQTP